MQVLSSGFLLYFNMALIKKDGKFFKVGEEIRSDVHAIDMSRARDKEKKSESLTRIEPLTFRTPVGCSNHWATKDS